MVEANRVGSLEFKWGKKRGIGGKNKNVQFYESFIYDGVEYMLYDSVFLYEDGWEEPHVGKLIKIWELPDKTKKVKVLWFFRPCEISKYLKSTKTGEKELFLASGEGVGLANVNPLEAIAGKCNVVCISNDSKNQQPSNEELQMADFLFYRTFDVGKCEISDKIDDKIVGIEVKFLFNRASSLESRKLKLNSGTREIDGNVVAIDKSVYLSKESTSEECNNSIDASVKENGEPKLLLAKQKLGENCTSRVSEESIRMVNVDGKQGNILSNKTISKSRVQENMATKDLLVKQTSFVEEKFPCSVADQADDVANTSDQQENTYGVKTNSRPQVKETTNAKHSLGKQNFVIRENFVCQISEKLVEMPKSNRQESTFNDKNVSRSRTNSIMSDNMVGKFPTDRAKVEEKDQVAEHSREFEDRSSKRAKINDDKNQKSSSDGPVMRTSSKSEDKPNLKCAAKHLQGTDDGPSKKLWLKEKLTTLGNEDFHGNGNGPMKRPKFDEKLTKRANEDPRGSGTGSIKKPKLDEKFVELDNTKLPPSQSSDKDNKTNKVIEDTRQPEVDKSKWFKSLPWSERMQAAHEQGRLVVLRNLDPSYTSGEVEDIIWNAFKESCTAKMIQRTAFSSPLSGLAYVIFKKREAAEKAVIKLDEDCLLLSNGRPLLGSIATPFLERRSAFCGHISIDKLRLQLQREMRDAVSTSHCSQPNTIEYDMAMEWSRLQEMSVLEWKKLYKQQGEELRKLKVTLKSR